MILPTMTGEEMLAHMRRDSELMEGKLQALEREFRHTLKKYPLTKFAIRHYTVKNSHQEYLIIHKHIGKDRNRGVLRNMFAIVQKEDKKLYITVQLGHNNIHIYTQHFFERYRERMQLGDISIEQAIGIHTYRTGTMLRLYYDDDGHYVYASSEGISLCEYDDDITIWFRTFVSSSMLKISQFKSWSKVQENITQTDEYAGNQGFVSPTRYEELIRRLTNRLDDIDTTEAHEIYAQFYEK